MRPSGDRATDQTWARCPRSRASVFRVAASHRTSVRSVLAVANVRPSRATAIVVIKLVCSFRLSTILPSATFQIRSLPSPVPVSRCFPSGAKTADPSMPGNLAKFERTVRDGKSQTWNWLPDSLPSGCPAVTRRVPSGENATARLATQIRSSSLPKKRSACHVSVFQTR